MVFRCIILLLMVAVLSLHAAPDNRGTEFIITYGQNSASAKDDEIFITTSRTTTVSVTVTSPGWSSSGSVNEAFTITAGTVKQLFISNNLRNSGTALSTKGILISASDEVVVYGLNRETYSMEMFCALPIDVLGKEYYAASYYPQPSSYKNQIQVVGIEDSTQVSIRLPSTSGSVYYGGITYQSGQTMTLTMNRYSTFQLQTSGDISGTYVTSDKNVALFTGTQRTSIGSGSSSDHIVEQAVPVDNWGKEFVLVPIPDRTTGDYFRFMTSESGCTITVTGKRLGVSFSDSIYLANAGDSSLKLYQSQLYCHVSSNKPIMIMQFSLSQVTEEADPSMLLIPPIQQYAADYTFSTPQYSNGGSYNNYFMFVVKSSEKDGLQMDGASLPSNTVYNDVPNTNYVAGYTTVSDGSHTIRHTSPISVFGGFLFGRGKWEAYGFPSGMRMSAINTVCTPTTMVTGDGIDNDCDGLIDEELCTTANNGADDDGDGTADEDCATPSPIDGNWGSFGSYGSCSLTCKSSTGGSTTGSYTRTRACDNPAPQYDGAQCSGSSSEITSCTPSSFCPINGGFTSWGSWGSCSATCGGGTLGRYRTCSNPAPLYGGSNCTGDFSESQSCSTNNCPVDGGFTTWSSWDTCSVTCAGGTQGRTRTCTNPSPQYNGASCSGDYSDSQSCNTLNCPIDGGFTTWSSWDTCSATCAGGTQGRTRTCTNPAPQYNGASCSGAVSDSQSCNTLNCPIDGGFTSWSSWDTCTVTCAGGTQGRTRTCSNPSPQYNGANCTGDYSDSQSCNTLNCPIDGGFSSWSSWDTCTVTCAGGTQGRTRTCSNPSPQYNGANCTGDYSDSQSCNTLNCPIDGGFTTWLSWDTCTVTCAGGTQGRTRTCTNPSPQYNGATCSGDYSDSQSCNTLNCPIDGGLTSWTSWDACTVTCGGGTSGRTRSCTNPSPQYGGASCTGNTTDIMDCNTQVCIIDGGWGSWASWGTCTTTCNNGTQSRSRVCDTPAPANGGLACPGLSGDFQYCNPTACPTVAPGTYIQNCPNGWFTCRTGGISCIQEAFKCDCDSDCDDSSDEDPAYASCNPAILTACLNSGTVHPTCNYVIYMMVAMACFILTQWKREI